MILFDPKKDKCKIFYSEASGEIAFKSNVIKKLFAEKNIKRITLKITLENDHTFDFDYDIFVPLSKRSDVDD